MNRPADDDPMAGTRCVGAVILMVTAEAGLLIGGVLLWAFASGLMRLAVV